MNKTNFIYYSCDGGWLQNKCCVDCGVATSDMIVDWITKFYLYYCEMGLKSARYDKDQSVEEKEMFDNHECSMILCVKCRNVRFVNHSNSTPENNGKRVQQN